MPSENDLGDEDLEMIPDDGGGGDGGVAAGALVWRQYGNTFQRGGRIKFPPQLAPGIYHAHTDPTAELEWGLTRVAARFEFHYVVQPFKQQTDVVRRVSRAWQAGNLGILLNGIKGSGKSVAGQLLANWCISQGIPVLVVMSPRLPLTSILGEIEQPLVILFDEFEKVFSEDVHQEHLLTLIDGMVKGPHKRLFVFMTNKRDLDSNLLDRPSRIRYVWDFGSFSPAAVQTLLDTMLRPEYAGHQQAIRDYLHKRAVCSLDAVKAVIEEVNLFGESPEVFGEFFNLSPKYPAGYHLEIWEVSEEAEPVPVRLAATMFFATEYLRVRNWLFDILTPSGRLVEEEGGPEKDEIPYSRRLEDKFGSARLQILSGGPQPNEYYCKVWLKADHTWLADYPNVMREIGNSFDGACLALDYRPVGWRTPSWAHLPQGEAASEAIEEFGRPGTVYGTAEESAVFLVRFFPVEAFTVPEKKESK